MVVPKSDNTVRICGDYKATINQSVEDEPYVLPTTQDLYTALVGSKVCSKLDLSHPYAQLNVDKESQEYLTISYLMVSSHAQKYFRQKWIRFSRELRNVYVSRMTFW